MAGPKRRTSRHRRAQWKASRPDLVPIRIQGVERLVPRRLVRAYQRELITP